MCLHADGVETPSKLSKSSSQLNSTQTRDSPLLQNGTVDPEPSHIGEPANPRPKIDDQLQKSPVEQIPDQTLPIEPVTADQEQSQPIDQHLGANGEDEHIPDAQEPQANGVTSKEPTNRKGEESVPKFNDRPPPGEVTNVEVARDKPTNDSGDVQVLEPRKKRQRGRHSNARRSSDQNEETQAQKQTHRENSEPLREKRPRSRRSMSARTSPGNGQAAEGVQDILASTSNTRSRRRSSEDETTADVSIAGAPEKQPGTQVNGAPEPETTESREEDQSFRQPRESKKQKRAGRPKAHPQPSQEVQEPSEAQPAEPQQQPEPPNEPESTPRDPSPVQDRRGRGRPSRKSIAEREPDQQLEQSPNERETTPRDAAPAAERRGRGRPRKSTETEPDSQQPARQGDQPPKRKTRTRGETVPVTVHRLANAASLGGPVRDADSSADEESADELSTQQKTKLPSRGGVNPADVLSQICRETLEKTLTTLKNGISNETNPGRRSEFVRKRKAVEAYGTELEGRLFDLSEILDSNFVLGVQVKKAKREMMDMRSRLYHLRREREEVALQMDAVRSRHTEDEGARMVSCSFLFLLVEPSLTSVIVPLHNQQLSPQSPASPGPQSESHFRGRGRRHDRRARVSAPNCRGGHQFQSSWCAGWHSEPDQVVQRPA